MLIRKKSTNRVLAKKSINLRSKPYLFRLKDFFKSCLQDDGIPDKTPIIKIWEDIEAITKQYKGGKGINSDEDDITSEEDEEDWIGKFIKDYDFKCHSVKEELAEARATN